MWRIRRTSRLATIRRMGGEHRHGANWWHCCTPSSKVRRRMVQGSRTKRGMGGGGTLKEAALLTQTISFFSSLPFNAPFPVSYLAQDSEWVVYLDSDAFFADLDVSILDLFAKCIPWEVLNSDRTMFFGNNAPFNYDKVCSGVFFIKNTPAARTLLTYWWNKDSPHTNMAHPYEQEALYDDLYNNASTSIMQSAIYMSLVLQFYEKRKELPIRHVWSNVHWVRSLGIALNKV